jgi:hypothetical protein
MRHRLAATVAAAALLFAACGGETATNEIASLDSTTLPSSDTTAPAEEASMEDGLIAFTECLREQGLDVDDPTVGPDGNLQLPPISVGQEFESSDGGPPDQATMDEMFRQMDAVFAECEPLLGEVAFTNDDLPGADEFEDQLLEYAACMRENGVDMPDPDLSGNGGVVIDLGSGGPGDTDFEAADEACRHLFGGFGGGLEIVDVEG